MKRLIATIVALLALGGGIAWTAVDQESSSAFSQQNGFVDEFNGGNVQTRRLLEGPSAIARDPALDPTETALVIPAVPEPLSSADAGALDAFLRAGGTVVLADAFGHGGSAVGQYGIGFERVRFVAEDPSATAEVNVKTRSFSLVPGNGTALRVAADAEATVWNGPVGFLDRDGDWFVNASDPRGSFPILARMQVGAGTLVVSSDPSLLAMNGDTGGDNRAWRRALFADLLPNGGTILIDESDMHASLGPRALALLVRAATTPPWQWISFALAVGLTAAIALATTMPRWASHQFRPNRFIRRSELADERKRLATGAQEAPSYWSPRGTAAILLGFALVAAGIAMGSRQATTAGSILLGAAMLAGLLQPPAISANRRTSVTQVRERTALPMAVELRLEGKTAQQIEIRDAVPEEFNLTDGGNWFRVRLQPRATAQFSYVAEPALRGPYRLGPLQVRTSDALQLRTHERSIDEGAVVHVAPLAESVRRLPFATRVPRITIGPHMVNRSGDGSEFLALREYTAGDSMRIVNWKASARSTNLMVNQRVHESQTTVTFLLDARTISGAGPANQTPLAHGARVLAGLAHGSVQARDKLKVAWYGDGVDQLPPVPSAQQLHRLTEVLSGLAPHGQTRCIDAVEHIMSSIQPGMPVVIMTGMEDDDTAPEAVRRLRGREALPVLIISPIFTVDDNGHPEPVHEEVQARRAAALAELRSMGATVFEALPGVPLDDLFRVGGA